jgi:UDP-N-acetylglucosamine 2-epimerase (non-hydrolysing)
MVKKTICFIFGTRPEVIKLWPLFVLTREKGHKTFLISTGQQKELLEETLRDLSIKPDVNLDLMQTDSSLETFLSKSVISLSNSLKELKPGIVIVQGDTSSALAGALSAYVNKIPIGHVEAGLRSGDLASPWPEEGNRRLIDSISTHLWVPTTSSLFSPENDQKIRVVGNTVVDALRLLSHFENENSFFFETPYILVTLHRRESFGAPMESAMKEIIKLSLISNFKIIFIKHPNPKVQEAISLSGLDKSNITIVAPLPYSKFIGILRNSKLLITDSGGLQEEAATLKIPLIVVRDTTERGEAISQERIELVGASGENLVEEALKILGGKREQHNEYSGVFGDGYSSERILEDIELELNNA